MKKTKNWRKLLFKICVVIGIPLVLMAQTQPNPPPPPSSLPSDVEDACMFYSPNDGNTYYVAWNHGTDGWTGDTGNIYFYKYEPAGGGGSGSWNLFHTNFGFDEVAVYRRYCDEAENI